MKRILIITCTSYTIVSVLAALLSDMNYAPLFSPVTMLQLFLVTIVIAVLMFAAETIVGKLDFYTLWLDLFIRLAICFGVVFFGGVLFGWFALSWTAFLNILPLTIPTFVITYFIAYVTIFSYAQNINAALKKRKESPEKDKA